MTREDYLKEKIKEQGTQREFAAKIGMPPSTLFSILRNVGGASIDNIIKICKGLNIKPDELAEIGEEITIPSETKGTTQTLKQPNLRNTYALDQVHACFFLLQKICLKRTWKKQSNT